MGTKTKAKEKAVELYDAGEGKYGTDYDNFFKLLLEPPPPFLRDIDEAYREKYKKSIFKAIKNELTFTAESAVLYSAGLAVDPYQTIAKEIQIKFKGIGMDA